MTFCAQCGHDFTPDQEHPYQKFCCIKHRKQFGHKKERPIRTQKERDARARIACGICGNLFTTSHKYTKCCSDECKEKAHLLVEERERTKAKEKARADRKTREPKVKICLYCGVHYTKGGSSYCCDGHRYAAWFGHERFKPSIKSCIYCGEEFETTTSNQICCCQKHTKYLRNTLKRLRMYGGQRSPYSREWIYERDNYICYICGHPLDTTTLAPSDYSPSIDHVVPIARGGNDDEFNVRAAHFRCNTLKGVKLIEEMNTFDGHPIKFDLGSVQAGGASRTKKIFNARNPINV